jgi:hypothetical protein
MAFAQASLVQAEMLELFEAGEFEGFSRAIQRTTVDHKNPLSFFALAQNAFDAPADSGEAGHFSGTGAAQAPRDLVGELAGI